MATSAETAALDQQVGGFERVLGVMAAAHPQQPVQPHAGGGGRKRVEGIFGIHQGADFLPRAVASARMETSRLVRPEEAAPMISVRQPRGRPPVAASTSWTPVRDQFGSRAGLPLEPIRRAPIRTAS